MSITSAGDVDESLRYLSLVPADERGAPWRAYCDALLELRRKMEDQ
jgi:hypothetical protein